MQDQRSKSDVRLADDEIERVVLALLLESEARGPWSERELGQEIGSELRATDAVFRLHATGLVHRCNGFTWATRAAERFSQLA